MSQVIPIKQILDNNGDMTITSSTSREIHASSGWLEGGLLNDLNRIKLERLSAGDHILDLSMINTDIAPPRYLLDRLMEASVKSSNHRYSVSKGIRKLRHAFASLYDRKFAVKLDPESEICVTMGTKDAIVNTLMLTVQSDQYVLMGQPAYPAYVSACQVCNIGVRFFEISSDPFKMIKDIECKLLDSNVRLILLNFPNNPTGITMPSQFYNDLINLVKGRNITILNDFVYGEMGHRTRAQPSLLEHAKSEVPCIESYSLSKAYNIPGWRVGALCGNSQIVARLAQLKSHIDYGIFLPLQIASSSALSSSQDLVSSTSNEYQRRSKVLCDGLMQLGWDILQPEAGACLWARIPDSFSVQATDYSVSLSFAKKLLEYENVFISPGIVYGEKSDNWVRFALVLPSEQLYEVVRRIENFFRKDANA